MKKEDALIRANDDSAKASFEDESSKSGFEPDKAENLPQLQVPDLPEDATSVPPEVMENLPVLTEAVSAEEQAADEQVENFDSVSDTQDVPAQSESWVEVCQMRVTNLAGEIQALHERLDRFEKRTKA